MLCLPGDLHLHLLEFMSAADVYMFTGTNKELHRLRPHVLHAFRKQMAKFLPPWLNINIAPSVFSGSIVLQALLGENWACENWTNFEPDLHFRQWQHSDIDIFSMHCSMDRVDKVLHKHLNRPIPRDEWDEEYVHVGQVTTWTHWPRLIQHITYSLHATHSSRISAFDLAFCRNTYDGRTLSIHDPMHTLLRRDDGIVEELRPFIVDLPRVYHACSHPNKSILLKVGTSFSDEEADWYNEAACEFMSRATITLHRSKRDTLLKRAARIHKYTMRGFTFGPDVEMTAQLVRTVCNKMYCNAD